MFKATACEVGAHRLRSIRDTGTPQQFGQPKSVCHPAEHKLDELNKANMADHRLAYEIESSIGHGGLELTIGSYEQGLLALLHIGIQDRQLNRVVFNEDRTLSPSQ